MLGWSGRTTTRCAIVVLWAAGGLVGDAHAHIDLLIPEPREHGPSRDPNSNVKRGPCGQELNARSERVSVFEPGATLAVTWVESSNHRSYYRVAFDVDGDDGFPTFRGNGVGTEGIDPESLCPVDGQVILAYDMDDRNGGSHTLEVRLPDVECERCTLQVVQFMYDTGRPYYFQCADVALRRSLGAAALDAGGDAAPSTSDASTGAQQQNPSAAPGCSSQIAPDPPSTNDDEDEDEDEDDSAPPPEVRPSSGEATAGSGASTAPASPQRSDGGCSIHVADRAGPSVASWLTLASAWAIARRRRARRENAAR